MLKYLLLNVKLRFKSQHVVHVFYESRNCKGITACKSEYKYQRLHNRLLQDKEMTVRRDCDQSERVFLQNITHLLVNTQSLFLFILIIFIII